MRSLRVMTHETGTVSRTSRRSHFSLAIISVTVQLQIQVFWVRSVCFNLRNILPKYDTFPPRHPVDLINLTIISVLLVLELCHTPFYNSLLHLMNSLYTDRHWKEGLSIYLATHFIHNVLQLKYMFHDIFFDNSWPAMLIFWIGQQWHKHLQK